ncbi:hypothetical protein ACH5RR_008158 [Cinchona calisaya]|uniref:DUF642 domain-containing protein n=1 Tax=Cinchona calisaya TaxID=153742 RepID=A0ABD3AD55_9GENT
MKGTRVIDPHSIPNWEISGFVEYIKSGKKQGDMLLIVPEGNFAVRLGDESLIKTKVKVQKGIFYSLSFSASRTCAQEEVLKLWISPNKEPKDYGLLPIQTTYSSDGWDAYSWGFIADSDDIEITIQNPGREKDPYCGPLIDTVAIKTLRRPVKTRGNLMKNGNFEEGPYIFPNTGGVLIPPNIEDDHSPLPGWIIESLKAVKYIDSTHFGVPEGKRAIELIAGRESAIAQVVQTVPGWWYDLIFLVGDAKDSCQGSMLIEAFARNVTLEVPFQSSGKGQFIKATLRFKAISTRSRVRFLSMYYHMKSDNTGSLCGPVIDDVRLFSVRSLHV